MSPPDFDDVRDITIIGAGPVGLSAAFWAGMRQASCRIVEALPEIGGPLTDLYPEKGIIARDLVEELRAQALEQFDVPVHLGCTAHSIEHGEFVTLHTDAGPLVSRTVIVAGGHGGFEPRRLPISDFDVAAWEGRGASYVVGSKDEFAGKR